MSTETIATRTDEQTNSAVEALSEDRSHESKSKAAQEAIQTGLRELGYLDGGRTPASRLVDNVAIGIFHVGATLVGLAVVGISSAFFVAGISVLVAALGLVGVSRFVVPRFEPAITNSLPQVEVKRYGR